MAKLIVSQNKSYIDGVLRQENPGLDVKLAFTTSFFDDKPLATGMFEVKNGQIVDHLEAEMNDDIPPDLRNDSGSTDFKIPNDGVSLYDLTKKELVEIAKEMRIESYSTLDKDGLVIAIESMNEQNAILADTSTSEGTGLAFPAKSSGDVNPV